MYPRDPGCLAAQARVSSIPPGATWREPDYQSGSLFFLRLPTPALAALTFGFAACFFISSFYANALGLYA
jgi:hypothetical protein